MTNFSFLRTKPNYTLFAPACIEAEQIFATSPALCAVGCRKALELAVKWLYSVDKSLEQPYKDNLQSLISEKTFVQTIEPTVWLQIRYVVKLGNHAVHTGNQVSRQEALSSLRNLFAFIQWLDYCYGTDYEERTFDPSMIPTEKTSVDVEKIRKQESLLQEKDAQIEGLLKQLEELQGSFAQKKETNQKTRHFAPNDLSEYATRKQYIDLDLKLMGWKLEGPDADVAVEYEVTDMENKPGQKGYVDYVLFGKDGMPLAVIEAKRTSKDPKIGRKQAMLYAECLERKYGRKPMMFTTNGFDTNFWDDVSGTEHPVVSVFSKGDLQKLMDRRTMRKDLTKIQIDDKITDRYYQKEAIRAVCEKIMMGKRKHLLVMATGTGKTRTASSLTDVLSRGGYVTNVLFLADRTALVKQAKEDFQNYLPGMSLCNLCINKEDRNARIVFSTYPTMLNAITEARNTEGNLIFTPAHFDLIIIDESHRSIFKKYRAIFEYFDGILVGLTATPKDDVAHNTYDFFECKNDTPTYAYDYHTAVEVDHVLVPFYNYEVKTDFTVKGIHYDDLSEKDKERFEEDFEEEDGSIPGVIPPEKLNQFIFNQGTVDQVLEDLMERGIKVDGGDRIGKTIIFAQNKRHAEFIRERFDALYPQYKGKLMQRVICDDNYAQSVIDDFKKPDGDPQIVVSVDMMDTGVDVPTCVNLMFFKKVYSKTKFWQMIGRGTRLAPDLICQDQIDGEYTGKKRFLIFDYCLNFDFFRMKPNGYEAKETKTLAENIFGKQIMLLEKLQDAAYAEEAYQDWRKEMADTCHEQVTALNEKLLSVRVKRKYVEVYKKREAFDVIEGDKHDELIKKIAPLVFLQEDDEAAKRFDNFMYGLMLARINSSKQEKTARRQLGETANMLLKKATIPQVKEKLPLIQSVQHEDFWKSVDLLSLESIRKELRELMKFLVDDQSAKKIVITNLTDPILESTEGKDFEFRGFTADEYRKKAEKYILEHGDTLAIHKLTHNIRLAEGDYQELERIFTHELGSKEDYDKAYPDTPFGLLVRKVAKLDHEAALAAFSKFINDESLNAQQINFVRKIIHHIEKNGYMDDTMILTRAPFDHPVKFIRLFDENTRKNLIETIEIIKANAL